MNKNYRLKLYFLLCLSLFVLSGCSLGKDYVPPSVQAPGDWKGPTDGNDNDLVQVDNWWEIFNDPKLNELEALAVENNKDLYIALDRVREARAMANIAKADLYPQIDLNPIYTNQEMLIELFQKPPKFLRAHELLYMLPLNLSYEVDLWGKIRDRYHSAFYNWQAQSEAYLVTLLMLTTDLGMTYFQLRTFDSQIDLLLATLKTRKKAYEINLSRYQAQIVVYSDVSRAGLEVKNAETDYYDACRQRALLENRIAVLLGKQASVFKLEHTPLTVGPPQIPAGIPSEILKRRPDIAEAERNMASQYALVKAAYASFFPSLVLTASGGFESPDLKDFLQHRSRYWLLGANADQTIFDGWRKTSIYDLQNAGFRQTADAYQQTVLVAFQEVEDALAGIDYYAKEQVSASSSVAWAKKTYQISYDRYIRGVTFYLDVQDSERDELTAKIRLNQISGARFITAIQLIKALGGDWMPREYEETGED